MSSSITRPRLGRPLDNSPVNPPLGRRAFMGHAGGALGAVSALAAFTTLPASVLAYDEKILEEVESEFNHIQVSEQGSVRTLYFIARGKRYIESRWDMSRPHSLDLDYARTMIAGFLIGVKTKKLMMMGLGGGQITNYLFERIPGLEIDAVDIDPEVVRIAKQYFGVPNSPRYRTYVDDGRVFIERAKTKWDMMMLDAFRGAFVPLHLKTKEFYSACLNHLSPQGVVVANLHNQSAMYPRDRRTLREVFPHQYPFVSERGNQTTFVASADSSRLGAYAIREHAKQLQPSFDFDLRGLAARYYMRRDWELSSQVLRDDFPPNELERGAARHNGTCVSKCNYQTK